MQAARIEWAFWTYRRAGAGPRDTGRNLLGIRTGLSARVAKCVLGKPALRTPVGRMRVPAVCLCGSRHPEFL